MKMPEIVIKSYLGSQHMISQLSPGNQITLLPPLTRSKAERFTIPNAHLSRHEDQSSHLDWREVDFVTKKSMLPPLIKNTTHITTMMIEDALTSYSPQNGNRIVLNPLRIRPNNNLMKVRTSGDLASKIGYLSP
jgi:hypothetical protein